MEITPTFIQYTEDLAQALRLALVLSVAGLACGVIRAVWTHRTAFLIPLPGAFSFGAFPLLLGGLHAHPSSIVETFSPQEDRVSSALYERVPPPRSLVRAEDIRKEVHPALHPSHRSARTRPLFPREPMVDLANLSPWKRGALDLRRTDRRRGEQDPSLGPDGDFPSHHVVTAGDTLWDIAANVLDTDDPRAIARYWPRLHKENVDVIGRDPNILRPGQVLSLPQKEDV